MHKKLNSYEPHEKYYLDIYLIGIFVKKIRIYLLENIGFCRFKLECEKNVNVYFAEKTINILVKSILSDLAPSTCTVASKVSRSS